MGERARGEEASPEGAAGDETKQRGESLASREGNAAISQFTSLSHFYARFLEYKRLRKEAILLHATSTKPIFQKYFLSVQNDILLGPRE